MVLRQLSFKRLVQQPVLLGDLKGFSFTKTLLEKEGDIFYSLGSSSEVLHRLVIMVNRNFDLNKVIQ